MDRALFLDVVVGQSSVVFKTLASEDEPLLVGRDAFLVSDLLFHVVDGVGALHVNGDGLACERLDEELHASSQSENKVDCALLPDVVVRQSSHVFQPLASEDQSLLVGGDALLVLDLGLHVGDGVRGLHVKCDGLASQCFHKQLHVG